MSVLEHLRPHGAHRFLASRAQLRAENERLVCDLTSSLRREAALATDLEQTRQECEETKAALGQARERIADLQQQAADAANAHSITVPAPCDLRVPSQQAPAPPPSPAGTTERFEPPAYVVTLQHSPQAAVPDHIPSWAETVELPVVQPDGREGRSCG
ncbi:hypothetical protein [Streptomyces sp. DH37]|uniref:hypothetical protein n=1 Tax=Streptomyces sp. DH37 TaxID=3040122 RepID=UPI0024434AE4|nr:hypothetical protein [Streptomyces sp. DH37]MDG9703755.1 hypothetical protein [Streptomyces sp. DH37]